MRLVNSSWILQQRHLEIIVRVSKSPAAQLLVNRHEVEIKLGIRCRKNIEGRLPDADLISRNGAPDRSQLPARRPCRALQAPDSDRRPERTFANQRIEFSARIAAG